jgi:tripartite-type tricarboxylate transporter receptor subunit TctC
MQRPLRRAALGALIATCAGRAFAQATDAERWPVRPVRMVVPFAPGGTTDILARIVATRLAEQLGQPVVVENKAGAGGNVGAGEVARAAPDGYTMLMGTPGPLSINRSLMKQVPFDPDRDFAAVGQVVSVQSVLVAHPAQPFRTFEEFVAYVRARPGQLTYASGGNGSSPHLAAELLKAQARLFLVHLPYRGDAPAVADVIGGQVPVMIANIAVVLSHVRSGRLRALAVAGPRRSPLLPDVPTIGESGLPGYSVTGWAGLVVPRETPRPIVQRLNTELVRALANPDVAERIAQQAAEVVSGTPEAFDAFYRAESTRWAKVIAGARITLD